MRKLFALLVAVIFMAGFGFAQDNEAHINQVGTTNNATVDQTGSAGGSLANVNQYGSNIAAINQLGVGSNTANINQGSNGAPVINNHQAGYSGDWQDGAFVTQNGESNAASINMTGNRSTGTIYQQGTSNIGSQNIGTNHSEMSGDYYGVWMYQEGLSNTSSQNTIAAYGVDGIKDMTVYQDGDGNTANQTSIAGYGSLLQVWQIGDGNTSNQYQAQIGGEAHTYVLGDGNTTSQYQDDPNTNGHVGFNKGYIDITGNDNISTEYQVGRDNEAHISVSTDLNEAHIYQTNDNNMATVSQSLGNGNFANIIQH